MRRLFGLRALGVLAAWLTLTAAPVAQAQTSGGNIYGTVTDESGARLPGATVTLTGDHGRRHPHDHVGHPGRLPLPEPRPGHLQAQRGPAAASPPSPATSSSTPARTSNLSFGLKVAGSRRRSRSRPRPRWSTPRRSAPSTTLTKEELAQVPQGRDPWAVLKTVPGVLVDRVSVAGNEAGQQSGFAAKGASPRDTMWNLDGVVITDIDLGRRSPIVLRLRRLRRDQRHHRRQRPARCRRAASGLNFVTKRGTNAFHGSVRGFFSHNDICSRSNLPDELEGDPRLQLDGSSATRPTTSTRSTTRAPSFGGPDRQGQALVLGLLRQERHPPRPPQPDQGQDPPQELERQAQLAGQRQRHGLVLLLQRGQGEARPLARRRRQRARLASSGTRATSTPRRTAACPAACTASSRSSGTTPSARTSS